MPVDEAITLESLLQGVRAAFEHAPALALVVAVALLAVPTAIVGVVVRFVAARVGPSRQVAPSPIPSPEDRTGFAPPRRVWLERSDSDAVSRYAITAEVTRIGREADNDITLSDEAAHRYHAAITRTADLDHYAVSLGGEGAGDMRINGTTTARHRLRDGDVIAIGGEKLTFRAKRI